MRSLHGVGGERPSGFVVWSPSPALGRGEPILTTVTTSEQCTHRRHCILQCSSEKMRSLTRNRMAMAQPTTTNARSLCAKTRSVPMLALLLSAISFLTCPIAQAEQPREVFDRAVSDFQSGRIEESVAGFDRLAKMEPEALPQLWQRGIALYYAGRFKDCRAQFESHRTVNPNDVENAAWHFLCVARAESPAKAKAALLPVGPDSRVPMGQIYQMLRGELTVEQVLKAGGTQPEGQFYAELYCGPLPGGAGQRRAGAEAHSQRCCRSLLRLGLHA